MKKIVNYIKLIRPKHYMKNGLIIVPLFFGMELLNWNMLRNSLLGILSFSFLASIIYIINDIYDIENDRKSESKRNRPLASGEISIFEAVIVAVILAVFVVILTILMNGKGICWLVVYLVLNIAYSIRLKHVPIMDIAILASGFLIRLLYGAAITDITISFWLCMTVVSFSFYMGLGKRRNELNTSGDKAQDVRGVLKYYNKEFLDKNMYMCLGLAITFYALWSGDSQTVKKLGTDMQIWTVPIVILLAMKYSLNIEKGKSGDPMEVILGDKWIIAIGVVYVIILLAILYL